jgi:hypothetical protein
MATYPVILYPRLIAEFRKTHQLIIEGKASGRGQKAEVFGQTANVQNEFLAVPVPRKKRSLKLSSIGIVVTGAGLVAIGVINVATPLGAVALLLGVLTATAPLLWRRKKSLASSRPHHYPLPVPAPPEHQPIANTDLKGYLSELADTMRGKVLQPDGVTDAPVGASEEAFRKVLERFFPERVSTQLRLPIPNWDGAYSTDFTISFPSIGVWIDVEIDEPYDYKTSNPTHCADDERDRNRNSFFLKNNWIVVRFSEEQVVRHPESCCKEIASVIQIVTGMTMYSQALSTVPTLMPMPMWTKQQAKKMAKAKSRDKYLKLPKVNRTDVDAGKFTSSDNSPI